MFPALMAVAAALLLMLYGLYGFAFRRRAARKPRDAHARPFDRERTEAEAFFDACAFEDAWISSADGLRLHGRLLEAREGKPMLLLFHGYRSSARNDFSCSLRTYLRHGFGLLLVDQRAHGQSEGRCITLGVRERYDCLDWARYVQERFRPPYMYLEGLSMGAATVLMAAGLDLPPSVSGIIADCGYTSARAILRKVIGDLHLPVAPVYALARLAARLFGGFDPEAGDAMRALARCRTPVLLIHGEADGFVPLAMSRENCAACRAPVALITVPGAEHGLSYLVDRPGVEAALAAFLAQTAPK